MLKTKDGFLSFYSINHGSVSDAETANLIYVSKYLNDGTLVSTTKLTNWVSSKYDQLAIEELSNGDFLLAFDQHLVVYSPDFSTLKKQVKINDFFPSSNLDMIDLKPLSGDLYLCYAYRNYDNATSTYTADPVTFVIDTNLEVKSDLSTVLSHFDVVSSTNLPFIGERPNKDQFTVMSSPKNGENYLANSQGDVFLQQINVQTPNNAPSGSIFLTGNLNQGETVAADVSLMDADGLGTLTYSWIVDGQVKQSGASNSFKLTNDHASKSLDLEISYIDGDGYLEVITTDFVLDIV